VRAARSGYSNDAQMAKIVERVKSLVANPGGS
jgi:hypothetical protein